MKFYIIVENEYFSQTCFRQYAQTRNHLQEGQQSKTIYSSCFTTRVKKSVKDEKMEKNFNTLIIGYY
jgi:hypothetical protein